MVKKTPAYKNRLRALELERSGGVTNKKKTQKNMDKYDIIFNLVFLLANSYSILCSTSSSLIYKNKLSLGVISFNFYTH